ncbi:putative dNTP triphosphohydrolase [alpha proteobacterium U9-1i]|nr:putative dNTP triphosphohydrolase [alpha proteobacterium U9-1i]
MAKAKSGDLFAAQYPEYLQPIAKKLSERYEFSRAIGAGKNGQTFLIKDRISSQLYCLKTISEAQTKKEERDRVAGTLRKEVEILLPTNHRCLPKIFDHDLSATLPYYVCTYHPGRTWEEFRLSRTRLTQDESAFVVGSLIDALEHLHERGRTHCDLHQDNILISSKVFAEGVLIIDFGSGHRDSDSDSKTPDKGNNAFKNKEGQKRHRTIVSRRQASADFRHYDFRALGRALQGMGPCFFVDGPLDQRHAYDEFCELLQSSELTSWREVKEAFRHVVDPQYLETDLEPLFVSNDGARKVITLPAGGNVPVGSAILAIINTSRFQRLRAIRQLSFCEWPFPGGVHSRFEHSIGVFGSAHKALRHLARDRHFRNRYSSENVRGALLGGLLHDIGHYPFAHVVEHYIAARFPGDKQIKEPIHHFANGMRIIQNDTEINKAIEMHWGPSAKENALRTLEGDFGPLSQVLDGPIDCDKIDYLKRDSFHCGVPYGTGFNPDEVIASYRCPSEGDDLLVDRIRVHTIEGFMVLQDQMLSAVYWHQSVRAIMAMFHRFLDGALHGDRQKIIDTVARMQASLGDQQCLTDVFWPLLKNAKSGRKSISDELAPLINLHFRPNWSEIYTCLAQYSTTDKTEPKRRARFNVFRSIINDAAHAEQTNIPIEWGEVKRLRGCFMKAFIARGEKPGAFEILVDVPWGKGTNREITVYDQYSGDTIDITKVSHLAPTIFKNPTAYSAPVRVYISPRLQAKQAGALANIRKTAEEFYADHDDYEDDEG